MGNKYSGRRPIYHDKFHKGRRRYQIQYDREIAEIREKHNCSFAKAQEIRRKSRGEKQ